jgi:hypothetical protein
MVLRRVLRETGRARHQVATRNRSDHYDSILHILLLCTPNLSKPTGF